MTDTKWTSPTGHPISSRETDTSDFLTRGQDERRASTMNNTEMPDGVYLFRNANGGLELGPAPESCDWLVNVKYARADKAAPVERIDGLAEAIDRIFPMQLVSGDAMRRTSPHSKTMLNSTEKWAVTNSVSCSGQKLSQLLLDIEHACRSYLALQGGE